LRTRGGGEYLDRRGKICHEAGDNFIMRSFIIFPLQQILLERSNPGILDAYDMQHTWRDYKCIQNLARNSGGKRPL
jgi:hypothetical protein